MFEKQRKFNIFKHPVKVHKNKKKMQKKNFRPLSPVSFSKRDRHNFTSTYVTTITRANVKSTIILLEPETWHCLATKN